MLNMSRENEGLCHERYDTDIFKENVNNMKMPEQYCRQILLFPLFHETFLILSVKYRRTIWVYWRYEKQITWKVYEQALIELAILKI